MTEKKRPEMGATFVSEYNPAKLSKAVSCICGRTNPCLWPESHLGTWFTMFRCVCWSMKGNSGLLTDLFDLHAFHYQRFLLPRCIPVRILAVVKHLTGYRFFAIRISDGHAEVVVFARSGVSSIDRFAFHRESMTQALNSGPPCPSYPVRRNTEEPVLRQTQNNRQLRS